MIFRYLTLAELAAVCEHIGMDDMNEEELHQLFDKLDKDSDGRVSFQEFTRVIVIDLLEEVTLIKYSIFFSKAIIIA